MFSTRKVHIIVMLILSVALTYATVGVIIPKNHIDDYSTSFMLGRAFSSALLPLLVVSLISWVYKLFKKTQIPSYILLLWSFWVVLNLNGLEPI